MRSVKQKRTPKALGCTYPTALCITSVLITRGKEYYAPHVYKMASH